MILASMSKHENIVIEGAETGLEGRHRLTLCLLFVIYAMSGYIIGKRQADLHTVIVESRSQPSKN